MQNMCSKKTNIAQNGMDWVRLTCNKVLFVFFSTLKLILKFWSMSEWFEPRFFAKESFKIVSFNAKLGNSKYEIINSSFLHIQMFHCQSVCLQSWLRFRPIFWMLLFIALQIELLNYIWKPAECVGRAICVDKQQNAFISNSILFKCNFVLLFHQLQNQYLWTHKMVDTWINCYKLC